MGISKTVRFVSSLAALLAAGSAAAYAAPAVPRFDHIVVVVEENHAYSEILGSVDAPYINALARRGALLTASYAVTHPSEPNYFALYAGRTFDVTDDGDYEFTRPSLASSLYARGRRVFGYVDEGGPRKHNPWESFSDSARVGKPLSAFPRNFSRLPELAFVIPNLDNDMHDGSIARGDEWLRQHLRDYARWARSHNSLLIVTFDEDDSSEDNRIVTIFYGAGVRRGRVSTPVDHYGVLRTICDGLQVEPVGRARRALPVSEAFEP